MFLTAALAVFFLRAKPVELEIYAFDDCGGCFAGDNPCKPCSILEQLHLTYYGVLEQANAAEGSRIRMINTRGESGRAALEEVRNRLDLPDGEPEYPLVVLNGTIWFNGESAPGKLTESLKNRGISAFFASAPKQTASFSEIEMVYFYSEFCGDCVRASKYVDAAEEALTKAGYRLTRHSVDTDEGYALLTDYLSDYGLAHKSATVPYIFLGRESYFGSAEISTALEELRQRDAGPDRSAEP